MLSVGIVGLPNVGKSTLFNALSAGQAEVSNYPFTTIDSNVGVVPIPDPSIRRKKTILQGDVPSPINPPPGCHFHTRCPYAEARCKVEEPALKELAPGHVVSCHLR